MPVLIDGNNLLYAARAEDGVEPRTGRYLLCQALGQWAQRTGEKVHVIFDGPSPPPDLARQIGHDAIRVSYSGAGNDADTAVIRELESDSAARRLIVVSSDRQIVRVARRRRARPEKSEEFWHRVCRELARQVPAPAEPVEKRDGLAPQQSSEWLAEFGLDAHGSRGSVSAQDRRAPGSRESTETSP